MSEQDRECQATDPMILRERIMDCRIAKSEAEHWAARTIENLESERGSLKEFIETVKHDLRITQEAHMETREERDTLRIALSRVKMQLEVVVESEKLAEKERDALKAELEAQYKISVGNLERRERCAKDLDRWRGIAEKLAHELDYYLRHGIISSDNTDTVDVLAIYKAARK